MTIQSMARRSLRRMDGAGGFLCRPRRARSVYLTAFFLPFLFMAIMWAVCGVYPFGSKMILAHDQWHQYYPFFLDLRTRLQNGQSLFHSWTTGMGTNYLSLFAYYLASPLNFPAFLLPESLVMPYYTLTVLLRLGLAGLFCAIFFRKVFGRVEYTVACFSTAYAFSAFFMGYYWNAIWLDTVALLPLVALGTFSLLKERRCVLYVTSLFLSVYCSYYIGLFICIFVLLLFIGWHVVNWDDLAGFWARFWRIALCSAIALGMTAFLTIPAYLGLQATSSAVNKFPELNAMNMVQIPSVPQKDGLELVNQGKLTQIFTFFGKEAPTAGEAAVTHPSWIGFREALLTLRYGYLGSFLAAFRIPLMGLRSVLSNTGTLTTPTSMEGLPNIFCGFFSLILAALYVLCKRIPRRERVFAVLLLLFFADSFLFRFLDYLWHGMHFPNMLPYRFSFLWSFTVLFMAFRAYTQLETVSRWRALLLIVPVLLLVVCVISGGTQLAILATTAVALFALALLLFYSFRLIHRETVVLGLCVCMLLESLGCAILGVNKIGFTDSSYYPTKKEDSLAAIAVMKQREADTVDLWRAEVAMKQTLNDSTLLNINGISVFSSAANSRVSAFLQSIGLAASVAGNRYVYQEADPFTNLLLGVKYLIDRNGRNVDTAYFREIDWEGEVTLLQNLAYLPLGFLVSDNALEYDATQAIGLPFDRLNRLFREMTGMEAELYTALPFTDVQAVGTAELNSKTSTTFQVQGNCDEENYVEATFVMPKDGLLCIYSKGSSLSDIIYYLNGEKQYTWSDSYGYNRCMGRFSQGDSICLRYRAKSGKTGSVTLGGALFQTRVFDEAYAALAETSMVTTLVTDTRIEGAVHARQAGLLYLSIPNDNGWTLTVDGQPTRITPVGDAMIAVHLEPGLHAIALDFETPGFALGLKISIVCLAAFLALVIAALLLRFSRPPIVKIPVTLADPRRESPTPVDAPPTAEPIPVKSPTITMPKLDLTPSSDSGNLPKAARIPAEAQPTVAAAPIQTPPAEAQKPDELLSLDELLENVRKLTHDRSAEADAAQKSASFDALEHLDELDRLLDDSGQ